MLPVPLYSIFVFVFIVITGFLLAVLSIAFSSRRGLATKTSMIALLLLLWLIFQSTLSLNAWYMDRSSTIPHIVFPLAVNIGLIVLAFLTPLGRKFIDSLSLRFLLWIHLLRVPIELSFFWIAQSKQAPWEMTFPQMNYDILFGFTSPIFIILYIYKKKISKRAFLIWNELGLISACWILILSVGAIPSSFQFIGFEQPNYAMLHFPFIWWPSFLSMAMIFTHLVTIRRLKENRL